MKVQRQKEHEWLLQFVGAWQCSGEYRTPAMTPLRWQGHEDVRAIGGLWILAETAYRRPDGDIHTGQLTLGFDPQTRRFVGSRVGSEMSHLWVYDGEVDASGAILTLDSSGPDPAQEDRPARYRDRLEIRSDERVLTSQLQTASGEWEVYAVAHYRRCR